MKNNSYKTDFIKAKAYAKVVLEENFVTKPPVNPVLLANKAGLKVVGVDFEDKNISGYVNFQDKTIYIANSDPINRQTFTIAHELGHWFLHKDMTNTDDIPVLYRNGLLDNNTDPLEKEANTFAANLLVPTELLNKYKDDYSVVELAKIFNVSQSVIGFRLMIIENYV